MNIKKNTAFDLLKRRVASDSYKEVKNKNCRGLNGMHYTEKCGALKSSTKKLLVKYVALSYVMS